MTNSGNKKSHDMSIEEILKSIRGIIEKKEPKNHDRDEEVLELTNIVHNDKSGEYIHNVTGESLLSPKPANETSNLLKQFTEKATIAVKDSKKHHKATTVEDLVIEMIRPQLGRWLDENLPSIVRKAVEQEIKRLIPDDKEGSN